VTGTMGTMADPPRREQRRTHLDASVVPVERAYLARADALVEANEPLSGDLTTPFPHAVALLFAAEFRNLAEELHWWLPSSRSRPP
jgi:hypothetical protein